MTPAPSFGFFDIEGVRAIVAERRLVVRRRRAALVNRLEQILQDDPRQSVALIEGCLSVLRGDELGGEHDGIVGDDDECNAPQEARA